MTLAKFTIAIACLSASTAAFAQNSFQGAGTTSEIDCDGGTATIEGASNTIRVTGRCSLVVIQGADNRVTVELAPKGMIRITGAGNRVVWTTSDGSKPQIRATGADNKVSAGR